MLPHKGIEELQETVFASPYRLIEDKLAAIWNGFFVQLPNLIGAAVLLLLAWGATHLVRRWIHSLTQRRNREDLGGLLGSVATAVVMTVFVLISAAIVFPSVSPSDIFSTLGIGSVAIGFAFRDILQNLFAGILIVINRPFQRDDVIAVEGNEGTVERVEARATIIRTADGRRISIPNSIIYTAPLTINTANSFRRDEFPMVIQLGQETETILPAIEERVAALDDVLNSPPPRVFCDTVAGDGLHVLVRWFTRAKGVNRVEVRSQVVDAIADVVVERKVRLAGAPSVAPITV
ncbi:MAG: mechanosensitive ion channel family protein [Novosphingobium sp.]